MKRLVNYRSDDEDDDAIEHDDDPNKESGSAVKPVEASAPSSSKKPKILPALSSAFDVDPIDDPTLHQGRTRSRAYVHGTYFGHVYLTLRVSKKLESALSVLQADLSACIGPNYELHDLFRGSSSLHISLSHPLPLRKHQIQELEDHLAREVPRFGAQARHRLRLSLASGVAVYSNGVATQTSDKKPKEVAYQQAVEVDVQEAGGSALDQLGRTGFGSRRRAFVALRVSAGHEVRTVLEPFLRLHHLPLYHSNPQFHASFAWTLLGPDGRNPLDGEFAREAAQDWSMKMDEALPKAGWEVAQVECKIGNKITRYDL